MGRRDRSDQNHAGERSRVLELLNCSRNNDLSSTLGGDVDKAQT